jgi:hypothetical protein
MRISALLLGMLFAVGCSSSANKKLDEFADRACACTDEACAKKVEDDFQKWLSDNKDATGDEEKAKKSATRMMSCIMKAKLGKMGEKMDKMDKPADTAAPAAPADKPADTAAPADKPADSK